MIGSKSIPKVELHCHLEACFRVRTARELGRTLGMDVPEDPERFRREWLITEPVDNLVLFPGDIAMFSGSGSGCAQGAPCR